MIMGEPHDPQVAKLSRMSDYFGRRVYEQSRGIRLAKQELDGLWISRGTASDGHMMWSFHQRRAKAEPKRTA
jgi:hypothetical protein